MLIHRKERISSMHIHKPVPVVNHDYDLIMGLEGMENKLEKLCSSVQQRHIGALCIGKLLYCNNSCNVF